MSAVIGRPIDRVDGRLKITGAAKYAADYPVDDVAYAVPVQSSLSSGRVLDIDASAAEQAPGVLAVITRENAPKLHKPRNDFGSATKLGEARGLFEDERIYYAGQYLAIVVAAGLEQAMAAAALVNVNVAASEPLLDFDRGEKFTPADDIAATSYRRGDAPAALASAPCRISVTYTTPVEHHNPMEPSASVAVWRDGRLKLYDATQWVVGTRNVVADVLGVPRESVEVISRFVGGGFGCKGFIWPHSIGAALAARHVGRPVKMVLTRQQMFSCTGHRGATRQQIALGAESSGKLLAIEHENLTHASMVDDFIERSGVTTGFLYDCPNVSVKNVGARLNLATPTPMRAPGESTGLFALECALDELAWELNMDPVELRLKNYAAKDPEKNLPYSSKRLRECYQAGMEKFGWRKRPLKPASMRDGRCFVGWGMATATYPGYRSPGAARVRILPDDFVIVSSATQDIGTGTHTTLTQIAADVLGLSPERVRVELGDSTLPPAPVSGGSMTTASVTPAVKAAAEEALIELKRYASGHPKSPFHGVSVNEIIAEDGALRTKTGSGPDPRAVSYGELLRACEIALVQGDARVAPGAEMEEYALQSFGAQFSEVTVDGDTGEVRVTRHVAAFDVGRIINAKTARSQALGGITMGIGMALLEHTVYDRKLGRPVTSNLADYAIPVNADAPNIDVCFVEYPDPVISPVGARGLGEIGITGVAPAVANAIYHATGIRIRDLPITPDKLLGIRL